MKIAIVVGRFPALSETFILNQITGLIDLGHHVEIFADIPEGEEVEHEEVDRYGLRKRTHYFPPLASKKWHRILAGLGMAVRGIVRDPAKIRKALNVYRYGHQATSLRTLHAVWPFLGKQLAFDVIHCHFGPFGLRGMFLRDCGALKGKLVTTFHGADITEAVRTYGNRVYKSLFATGDLFLPVSNLWRKELTRLGCSENKIIVHHMGVNCADFPFRLKGTDTNKEVHFVSVCRLVEKKGMEYTIRAVSNLGRIKQNVRYDIVGDGPLRKQLEELIVELGVGDRIRIHGWKSHQDIILMLDAADILLAPSVTAKDGDQEGIPVALMEAMAMGLPVVSAWHSGIPELVEDGRTGLLVQERDVAGLTEKLSYLVDNPDMWIKYGRAGRTVVEQNFNIRGLNDKLVQLFERLNVATVSHNETGQSVTNQKTKVCGGQNVRYAYVKSNNVVEEVKRVRQRGGELPEGGPDAYVAHFLDLAGENQVMLISTHSLPSDHDEHLVVANIVARSLYWDSRWLKRFGNIAKRPLCTFYTRVAGSLRIFVYLVKFRPDFVLCWASTVALWATYLAAKLVGVPFVYCRHNRVLTDNAPWYQRLTGAVDRAIMRRAVVVIVHGPYLKQQMIDIDVNSARLLEFNWSFRHFLDGARTELEPSLQISDDGASKVILFIGRLQKSKGIFDLLDAVSDLMRNEVSLRLVYAGVGSDLEALRYSVAKKNLNKRVRLLGRVPHDSLPALISQSRFVVTPTQSWFPEGRCMATIEGLIMGKPVIAPNFGPFPYLVRNGENGILYEPDSIGSLRDSIDRLLRDQALYETLCNGAAETSEILRKPTINFSQAVRSAFNMACLNQ